MWRLTSVASYNNLICKTCFFASIFVFSKDNKRFETPMGLAFMECSSLSSYEILNVEGSNFFFLPIFEMF